jgi:hypothetical protein
MVFNQSGQKYLPTRPQNAAELLQQYAGIFIVEAMQQVQGDDGCERIGIEGKLKGIGMQQDHVLRDPSGSIDQP